MNSITDATCPVGKNAGNMYWPEAVLTNLLSSGTTMYTGDLGCGNISEFFAMMSMFGAFSESTTGVATDCTSDSESCVLISSTYQLNNTSVYGGFWACGTVSASETTSVFSDDQCSTQLSGYGIVNETLNISDGEAFETANLNNTEPDFPHKEWVVEDDITDKNCPEGQMSGCGVVDL